MLNESLISLFCAQMALTPGPQQEACRKATEAYFVQSGLSTQFRAVEGYANAQANAVVKDYASRETQAALAAGYVAAVKKEITVSTGRIPLINRVTVQGNAHGAQLTFGWRF